MKKKLNQTMAIKAFCTQCIYDGIGGSGSAITQITNCTSKNCPLYEWRPLNRDAKEVEKQAKIAAMTPDEFKKYEEKCQIAKDRMVKLREEGKM